MEPVEKRIWRICNCALCGHRFESDRLSYICPPCSEKADTAVAHFAETHNGDLPPYMDRVVAATPIGKVARRKTDAELLGAKRGQIIVPNA